MTTVRLRLITALFLAFVFCSDTSPVHATTGDQWVSCVTQLKETALQEGVRQSTVNTIFDNVEQLPRVIASDRSQPEFTQTFTDYFNRRVTDFRITPGRNLMASHGPLLARIQDETGIPPQYLMSFWGLETNFGSYFGKLSIPSALATLACDGRRADFFKRELLATLHIVDAGDLLPEELTGSWAGAIGHMQFMPTTYRQHAVDGDGDGRKDLVGSIDDALISAAAYLASAGWQPGFRWGREVQLPGDFDYALAGSDQWQPLEVWRDIGVQDVFGQPIKSADIEAALILPSGHTGPAFLVYPNFKVIMRWNRSVFYALSVGRLADRIAGAGRLSVPPPSTKMATAEVIQLQTQLNQLGYEAGTPDGILGPATRSAIRMFQKDHNQIADGYPSAAVFALSKQLTGDANRETTPADPQS